jgi:chemotaxis protein MotB
MRLEACIFFHKEPDYMKFNPLLMATVYSLVLVSCVSNKKFAAAQKNAQARYDSIYAINTGLESSLKSCQDASANKDVQIASLQSQNNDLNRQITMVKENNMQAMKQLQYLSVITASQAESIKKSMDNIGAKDAYIMDLQQAMARKDSLNMALVMNLKGAIGNMDDKDINIKVDKGVVFIDISDKLLFKSGSFEVTDKAKAVLGKVALVLNNQPSIEFMVEGHTDNHPFKRGVLVDNWDLSVKRASSVVRILQFQYNLSPTHITAAGRSEYDPVATNDTPEGRAANRRTRIVILPQLDQFFQLLERKK